MTKASYCYPLMISKKVMKVLKYSSNNPGGLHEMNMCKGGYIKSNILTQYDINRIDEKNSTNIHTKIDLVLSLLQISVFSTVRRQDKP